jgi:hypothetical protein
MKWVVHRKKFAVGLVGLITFLGVLAVWLSPVIDHKTGLEWADELFSQLAKNSIYFMPTAVRMAAKFEGVIVDLGVNPRWPGGDVRVAQILRANGISASVVGDGRVRIIGDLGLLAKTAAADADLLFKGNEQELQNKYGMSGKEVIYYWWTAFDGLIRRYIQENRPSEADFATFMTTRVLEPSYNFAQMEPKSISDNVWVVVFLLGFYILYTLWLGFSILLLFEGFGIGTTKSGEKKEA